MAWRHVRAFNDSRIARAFDLSPIEAAVVCSLAYHANGQTGLAFPSAVTIAAEMGYSDRAIRDALVRVVDKGVVVMTVPPKRGRPGTYFVPFSAGTAQSRTAERNPVPTSGRERYGTVRSKNGTARRKSGTGFRQRQEEVEEEQACRFEEAMNMEMDDLFAAIVAGKADDILGPSTDSRLIH